MKTNPKTNKPYTLLELSSVAREYYDSYRSSQIQSGFDKYVATDGEHTMFVSAAYEPETDDIAVFHCDVRRGANGYHGPSGTGVTLHRPQPPYEEQRLWHDFARFRDVPEYYTKGGKEYHHGCEVNNDRR